MMAASPGGGQLPHGAPDQSGRPNVVTERFQEGLGRVLTRCVRDPLE